MTNKDMPEFRSVAPDAGSQLKTFLTLADDGEAGPEPVQPDDQAGASVVDVDE